MGIPPGNPFLNTTDPVRTTRYIRHRKCDSVTTEMAPAGRFVASYADGIRKMTGITLVADPDPAPRKAEFLRWFRGFQKEHPQATEGYTRGGTITMHWDDYPMSGRHLPVDRHGPDEDWQFVLFRNVVGCGLFSDGEVIDPVNDPRVMEDIRSYPDRMPRGRKLRDYAFAAAAICMRTPPDLEGLGPIGCLEPNGITIRINGEMKALLWSDINKVGWHMGARDDHD